MSFKRSRSTTTGDKEVVTQRTRPPVASPDLRWKRRNQPIRPANSPVENSESSDQARPSIFRISSPTRETPAIDDENDDFLERCFSCNKIIFLDGDIFMYRDLLAFCSAECRQMHIGVERKMQRAKSLSGRSQPNAP